MGFPPILRKLFFAIKDIHMYNMHIDYQLICKLYKFQYGNRIHPYNTNYANY